MQQHNDTLEARTLVPLAALLALACLAVWLAACNAGGHLPGGVSLKEWQRTHPKDGGSGEFAYIGWLAGITLTIAVGLFIASIWVPLIATKTAGYCLLASVGLWALKYAMEKYLHLAVTVGVIVAGAAGAIALFPIAHTWINLHLRGIAKKIEAANPEGAAVLKEVADGGLNLAGRIKQLATPAAPAPAAPNGVAP